MGVSDRHSLCEAIVDAGAAAYVSESDRRSVSQHELIVPCGTGFISNRTAFGSCGPPHFGVYREAGMTSIGQVVVWILIGLIGGSLTGYLIKRDRRGFGTISNLGLGLFGAIAGGLLFRAFGLFETLDRYAVSLRDVMSPVVGSLLVLALYWYWARE